MKNKCIVFLVMFLFLMVQLPLGAASTVILTVPSHSITITTTETGLSIVEEFTVKNEYEKNGTELEFWIQTDAENVAIIANRTTPLPKTVVGNRYLCNLTLANKTIEKNQTLSIKITYTLPKATEYFQKTLTYDTTLLVIQFNKKELFRGETVFAGASTRLLLYKPTEAPLNIIHISALVILSVLFIGAALLILKKQRKKTGERKKVVSEDILAIKKTLLMTSLKEIEKQYRAKAISDETYTKLKEEYKQQIVSVMKQLDDIQTKH